MKFQFWLYIVLPAMVKILIVNNYFRLLKVRRRGPAKGGGSWAVPCSCRDWAHSSGEVSPLVHAAVTSAVSGDEEEDSDIDQLVMAMAATDHSVLKDTLFKPFTPDDNVRVKLTEWIKIVAQGNSTAVAQKSIPSVAIVAPDKEETRDIANLATAMWKKHGMHRRIVLVDIPAVHYYLWLLRTQDILFYILHDLQKQQVENRGEKELPQDVAKSVTGLLGQQRHVRRRWGGLRLFGIRYTEQQTHISLEKSKLIREITNNIEGMGVNQKISEIRKRVETMKGGQVQTNLQLMTDDQLDLLKSARDPHLGVFLRALLLLEQKQVEGEGASVAKQGPEWKEAKHSHDDVIRETAKKLRDYMERGAWWKVNAKQILETEASAMSKPEEHTGKDANEKLKPEEAPVKMIHLKEEQYEHILRDVFPLTIKNPQQDSKQATTGTFILVDDQIKELISKVIQELQENRYVKHRDGGTTEPHEDKSIKKLDTAAGKPSHDSIQDALVEETMKKIEEIQRKMKAQLQIKGIMDKIIDCLKTLGGEMILVILKLDDDCVSGWEETKHAFSMLGCIAGALMLQTTVNAKVAREYCYPPQEPIDCSLLGLYRDIALKLRKNQMNEDSKQIVLDILDKCNKDEFCMKIFVHALYANPKRSNEELRKLRRTMQQVSENSLNIIDKKMFKFSYSDLPKEYKSCLLYLAIFLPGQSIRRSTLIGRWVVEGLITKEDWASSIRHANQCFDALVDRWFVYPVDIGATEQVKSCLIGDRVHGFITKIARKQHIVETRLSHHLARHFSIFNDLQLLGSDRIYKFFQKLHEESRVSLIKVLDLQDCQCFGGKNQSYLKDICSKMLLLKFLSLRGTNVTKLPSEINNLRELEFLDIRQTSVPAAATVNVILLKLKRFLAGSVVPSAGPGSTEVSYVMVPDKIEKMTNMEVMSNCKARNTHDLEDIGKLWQLRKLGVVIEQKGKLIRSLLRTISDLHECLQSLSITLSITEKDPSDDIYPKVLSTEGHSAKLLESLSIRGTTKTGPLLQLLIKEGDQLQLAKVTLSGTQLSQADLEVLAKLPKLVCLRLRDKAYIDSKLTFNKNKFNSLKCVLIEGSNISVLSFEGGALKLEKIILSSTDGLQSISGVQDLHELKEVELKNSNNLSFSLFDKAKNISKVTLYRTILCQDEVEILAKMPNMRSLVLKEISYVQSQLIFYKDDFPRLNLLTIDFSVITSIGFTTQSATKLEKIIWSYTKGTLLSGIDKLPKLKELEFNGDFVPSEVKEALKKNKNKPKLIHNKPKKQYQEAGNLPEKEDAPRFPLFSKRKD